MKILFFLLITTTATAQAILTTGPAAGTFPWATLEQSGDTLTLDLTIGAGATSGNIASVDIGREGEYDVSSTIWVNGKIVERRTTCLRRWIYVGVSGKPHPDGTRIKAVYILTLKRV